MVLLGTYEEDSVKPDERRRWPRVTSRNRVCVTVMASPDVPQLEGHCYYCWTQDVSVGGLKFEVHSHVPLGAILKLDIQLEGPKVDKAAFQHMGRVAWEQEFEDGGLITRWLGVEITETLGASERFHQWQRLVDGLATA